MRKPWSRCRRGVARAWRHLNRRFSINVMLCVCCTASLVIMLVNIHGSQNIPVSHELKGRFSDVMAMFRHHTHSTQGFQIKEVKKENLSYYDLFPVGRRFMVREQQVQDGCRGRETELRGLSSEKWAFERIEVDTDRRTLYCPLLKVGSTFWRRIFYAMRQNATINTPYDISINKALMSKRETLQKLLPLNSSSTQQYLKESVNIMFVREPFSRLISGYVDKLFAPNPYFWTVIGKFIISNYRKDPSPQSLRCGHDVTFPEFVQYVVDTEAGE
ncbi:carbohydrate sulfotransferase 8-like [Haliotis rubra]|uniref:carbohydrate sulfotransferase 8-like n=1 Tax=Haliotis rubra TaxID=36100 RepID=UPI001EE55C5A|nr:carbohydrate sulfotransferase 8-like [Haliotis rubra]XP_046554988.1 carbohydrate sulfotransferase 8-like [Haliotis rubra]